MAAALCDDGFGTPVSVLHTAGSHPSLLGRKESGGCCTGNVVLCNIASDGTVGTVGHCHFGSLGRGMLSVLDAGFLLH